MRVVEREAYVKLHAPGRNPLEHFSTELFSGLNVDEIPVRFTVTETTPEHFRCETGVLEACGAYAQKRLQSKITDFTKRAYVNETRFNVALVIPTGIGAELGGHSGDGGAAARLLGSCCDTLITHPNVVNGADINELPENGLYVEGSVLSRLLAGTVALQKTRANRILVLIDPHPVRKYRDATINMVSAARAAAGFTFSDIVVLEAPLPMRSVYTDSGKAAGVIDNLGQVFEVLERRLGSYDAVAIASIIQVPPAYHKAYFEADSRHMVNPWGGVEAMLTHAVSTVFNVPSAHAPMMSSSEVQNLDLGVVDPRKAAETVSLTYFFSVLKGLHRSPRILDHALFPNTPDALSAGDVHALVIPAGCLGIPTLAARMQGIPVIEVRGNKNIMKNNLAQLGFPAGGLYGVENYLEAAGLLTALRSGLNPASVLRPLDGSVF
jgi:hypothetical protein